MIVPHIITRYVRWSALRFSDKQRGISNSAVPFYRWAVGVPTAPHLLSLMPEVWDQAPLVVWHSMEPVGQRHGIMLYSSYRGWATQQRTKQYSFARECVETYRSTLRPPLSRIYN